MSSRHKTKKGHRYSYSGADAKVWMHRGANLDKCFVESLQTISFSVHEPRGRVRALGYKGVKGFTRSIREIAGTMIFTVIEDHPLAHLLTTGTGEFSFDTYSAGYGGVKDKMQLNGKERRLATTIAPFDLTMIYATEMPSRTSYGDVRRKTYHYQGDAPKDTHEYSTAGFGRDVSAETVATKIRDGDPFNPLNYEVQSTGKVVDEFTMQAKLERDKFGHFNVAGLSLRGIEIITEGIVTSVNDMITEIQVQFLAKDYKEIGLGHFESKLDDSMDITYDEAYEFAKGLYRDTDSYDQYERDLKEFESDVYNAMHNAEMNMTSAYGYDPSSMTPLLPPIESSTEDFNYDPKTGTFTSTVTTVKNPYLDFPGDD